MRDKLGVEVRPGGTGTRPCRQGSSCWLGTGRVVEIDEKQNRVKLTGGLKNYGESNTRERWIQGDDHLVVLG